jgi:hypothetical protein
MFLLAKELRNFWKAETKEVKSPSYDGDFTLNDFQSSVIYFSCSEVYKGFIP